MSTVTPLADGEIVPAGPSAAQLRTTAGMNRSDRITVELRTPKGLPPAVQVSWPATPTLTSVDDFDELVDQVAELFAQARVALAFRGRRAR